jgi:hypothetical protein
MSDPEIAVRVGDLFRIDLPNGRFAFGCVLRDASVGIYPGTFQKPVLPAGYERRQFAFVTGIYSDILPSGVCPLIGRREFASVEDEWPPPTCYLDSAAQQANIYYKGRFTPCRPEDVVGLELMQVCELEHIVQRIIKTLPEIEP